MPSGKGPGHTEMTSNGNQMNPTCQQSLQDQLLKAQAEISSLNNALQAYKSLFDAQLAHTKSEPLRSSHAIKSAAAAASATLYTSSTPSQLQHQFDACKQVAQSLTDQLAEKEEEVQLLRAANQLLTQQSHVQHRAQSLAESQSNQMLQHQDRSDKPDEQRHEPT